MEEEGGRGLAWQTQEPLAAHPSPCPGSRWQAAGSGGRPSGSRLRAGGESQRRKRFCSAQSNRIWTRPRALRRPRTLNIKIQLQPYCQLLRLLTTAIRVPGGLCNRTLRLGPGPPAPPAAPPPEGLWGPFPLTAPLAPEDPGDPAWADRPGHPQEGALAGARRNPASPLWPPAHRGPGWAGVHEVGATDQALGSPPSRPALTSWGQGADQTGPPAPASGKEAVGTPHP